MPTRQKRPHAPGAPSAGEASTSTPEGVVSDVVDCILDERALSNGQRQFLVQWLGCSAATWEAEESIPNPRLIEAFEVGRSEGVALEGSPPPVRSNDGVKGRLPRNLFDACAGGGVAASSSSSSSPAATFAPAAARRAEPAASLSASLDSSPWSVVDDGSPAAAAAPPPPPPWPRLPPGGRTTPSPPPHLQPPEEEGRPGAGEEAGGSKRSRRVSTPVARFVAGPAPAPSVAHRAAREARGEGAALQAAAAATAAAAAMGVSEMSEEDEGEGEDEGEDEGGDEEDVVAATTLSDVYLVERLVGRRCDGPAGRRRTQYLVQWQGYSADEDSWEDASSILDEELMAAYDAEVEAGEEQEEEEEQQQEEEEEEEQEVVAAEQGAKHLPTASPSHARGEPSAASAAAPSEESPLSRRRPRRHGTLHCAKPQPACAAGARALPPPGDSSLRGTIERAVAGGGHHGIEARDAYGKWYKARAIDTRVGGAGAAGGGADVLVHYLGWASSWDEWVPFAAGRIRCSARGGQARGDQARGVGAAARPRTAARGEPAAAAAEKTSAAAGDAAGGATQRTERRAMREAAVARAAAPTPAETPPVAAAAARRGAWTELPRSSPPAPDSADASDSSSPASSVGFPITPTLAPTPQPSEEADTQRRPAPSAAAASAPRESQLTLRPNLRAVAAPSSAPGAGAGAPATPLTAEAAAAAAPSRLAPLRLSPGASPVPSFVVSESPVAPLAPARPTPRPPAGLPSALKGAKGSGCVSARAVKAVHWARPDELATVWQCATAGTPGPARRVLLRLAAVPPWTRLGSAHDGGRLVGRYDCGAEEAGGEEGSVAAGPSGAAPTPCTPTPAGSEAGHSSGEAGGAKAAAAPHELAPPEGEGGSGKVQGRFREGSGKAPHELAPPEGEGAGETAAVPPPTPSSAEYGAGGGAGGGGALPLEYGSARWEGGEASLGPEARRRQEQQLLWRRCATHRTPARTPQHTRNPARARMQRNHRVTAG